METHISEKKSELFIQKYSTPLSIIGAGIIIAVSLNGGSSNRTLNTVATANSAEALQESVLPSSGVTLPITWGDLGAKLVEVGAIDPGKLTALYKDRGGFPAEYQKLIEKNANE